MSHQSDTFATDSDTPASVRPSHSLPVKCLTIIGIVGLLGYVGAQDMTLFREWRALTIEQSQSSDAAIVGYSNVSPHPNYAEVPVNWFHHEGDQTLLWSGWKSGSHQWFRIGKGDLDRSRISTPYGKDSVQAIDEPAVEVGGGIRWNRIPDESPVAGLELSGKHLAYPLKLLEKVEVVNDLVEGVPIIVTYSPFVPERELVAVYDATSMGQRINIGFSGYFLMQKPLFYDRGTESLWAGTSEGLTAVAGRCKGKNLKTIASPIPVSWSSWRSTHPDGRLVVGAVRDTKLPRPKMVTKKSGSQPGGPAINLGSGQAGHP